MNANRVKVLALYKKLLITRNILFESDVNQLASTLTRLRNSFRDNINISDTNRIEELIKIGNDVDKLLRTSVYQTVKLEDNRYKLRVKPYMLVEDKKKKN